MRIKVILLAILLNTYVAFDSFAQEVMPLVYDVENTGADCTQPPLPSFSGLQTIASLPNPFMWTDSSRGRITSREDWRCRRNEIGAEIQQYELGTKPPRPDTIEASFTGDTLLTVIVIENGDTLTITCRVALPEGEGPFPAVIGIGFFPTGSLPADIFTSRGIATIQYNESQITPGWSNQRGDGPFFSLYPDKTRSKFIAWAWGTSRIIDGLEIAMDGIIDTKHLAITGCSYAGKIALFSGAFDERIALTISIESGGGGFTAWRVTETLSGSRETLRNAQGQQWYLQNVSQFNNAVTKLPYDHHELMAMVAPRALFVTGNPNYEWLADESGHVASNAAHEVWKALGVPERFGFSIVGGHDHCVLPNSQRPEVEAFVEKYLLGNNAYDTDISTSPYNSDLTPWITWETPDLEASTSVGNSEGVMDRFDLMQNYPNPFNPATTIKYSVKQPSQVELTIYNSLGQLIKTLVDGFKTNGEYSVKWDGKDNSGKEVPSGKYFYRIKIGEFVTAKKMVYVK
jgi:hypothetical protein